MVRPCSSARRRSWARAMAWNVPAVTDSRTPSRLRRGPQLTGGLAGEGDREDVRGIDPLLARLPRDAAGEHARLARTRARRGSPAARRVLVTASRCVASRPSSRASTCGTVPPGCDTHGVPRARRRSPEQQKAPSSLRCVAARISSGPFLPTTSEPSPQGCPRCSASAVGLRFPRFPGVVPFGSFTAPDPVPVRLPGLPPVPPDPRLASTARFRPFLPGTGPVFTGLRIVRTRSRRMQGGISAPYADTVPPVVRSVAIERSSRWSPTRSTRSPTRSAQRDGERRGDRRGVADARAARTRRARAPRCSVSTRECRSPGAAR